MATVYLVKDGPKDDRTSEGKTAPVVKLAAALGTRQTRFLGTERPRFNVATPTDHYRHVVIEIAEGEMGHSRFPRAGFYLVLDLDAAKSDFLTK